MYKSILGHVTFALVCLASDWLFIFIKENKKLPAKMYLIAVTDNMVHGIIALYAWLVICGFEWSIQCLIWAFGCAACACLIDADHFLAARSLNLKDALNLDSRPTFHCSSILVFHILVLALLLTTTTSINSIYINLLLCTFVAIATHHLRDAQRRGLWFWGFGSTPPIQPKILYLVLMISVVLISKYTKEKFIIMSKDASALKMLGGILGNIKTDIINYV